MVVFFLDVYLFPFIVVLVLGLFAASSGVLFYLVVVFLGCS